MLTGRRLPNGTVPDCIGDNYAIEVDFTEHWAEAIGQSLHYASALDRKPGTILVCKPTTDQSVCLRHRYLVQQTLSYWRIGMALWFCLPRDQTLSECSREEICGPSEDSICDTGN